MTDKMSIVGRDGKTRFEVEGTEVKDVRHCECQDAFQIATSDGRCQTCGLNILLPANPSEES